MPTHPPELENEINTVQSRIKELIESCPPQPDTRPIHEANLRDQDPTIASHPEMFPNFELPKEKKPASRRPPVRQNAKRYLRAAPKFLRGRPALARHSRKCQICRHPDRELIEDLYIHWHSANSILDFINGASDDDDDPDQNENNITWVAIYRHAYSLGLDELRRRNLRFAFELLIEQAGDITPTSAAIMAAARVYSCISDDGRWSDPPKHVIVTNQHVHHSAQQPAEAADFSHRPAENVSECGLSRACPPQRAQSRDASTPLCHTTTQLQDTASPVAPTTVRSSSLAGARFENRGQSPASDSAPPLTGHGSHVTNDAAVPCVPASMPPCAPASASPTQQPSTNCHSERVPGVVAGTTRLARRGGNLHFGISSKTNAEIRTSAKSRKNKEKTFSNR